MPKHVKLFTPGPGDIDEEVRRELGQPMLRHYGPEWMVIHNETIQLLQQIYQTRNDIYIVPGPASALVEMAVGSLAQQDDEIIIGSNGFFGDRLAEIAAAYGLILIHFDARPGEPLDPALLEAILRKHPNARLVALVHHETSTTVMNPLRDLAGVVRKAGRVLVVDAVSSLGGVELPVDDWEIDVCITAGNKCLETVHGIGFISISPRAWELVDRSKDVKRGWYLNLDTWRQSMASWGSWHPSPVTTPVHNVLAVRSRMRKILEAGLPAHYARYTHASQTIRRGLAGLGFEMFVPEAHASPIVTGVKTRPEFEVAEFIQWLVEERAIAIGGGLGSLAGKIFRVGHLGLAAEADYLEDFLASVEAFLAYKNLTPSRLSNKTELKSN